MPTPPSQPLRRFRAQAAVLVVLVACGSLVSLLCVASAEATSSLSWSTPASIDSGHELTAISCPLGPPEALCTAVDNAGNILTTTNPAGGASAWQKTNLDGSTPLTAVSCQFEACVAVDGLGNVLIGVPGKPGTWSKKAIDPSNGGLSGVSCPPRDASQIGFCLAVDHAGNAVLTFNGGTPWNAETIDVPSGHLTGLSCTEFSEWCITWDDRGNVLTSGDPYEGASAWTVTNIDPDADLTGVSCPYTDMPSYYNPWEYCLAVDAAGNMLGAAKPTGGASAWTTSHIETHGLTGVSCPFAEEAQFCAAVDDAGNAVTSSDPLGGSAAWSLPPIDPGTSLTGVSCPYAGSSILCVAIDATGHAIVGTEASAAPPPEATPQPDNKPTPPPSGSTSTSPTSSASPTTGSGTTPTATISSAQLKALLARQLLPSGKAATIGALLKSGGLTLPFQALEAGTATVQWYALPGGARLAKQSKAKPVLVASGKLTFSAAGTGKVRVRLTAAGKKLFEHARQLRLEAKGRFAVTGGAVVSVMKGFVLGQYSRVWLGASISAPHSPQWLRKHCAIAPFVNLGGGKPTVHDEGVSIHGQEEPFTTATGTVQPSVKYTWTISKADQFCGIVGTWYGPTYVTLRPTSQTAQSGEYIDHSIVNAFQGKSLDEFYVYAKRR